jgi:hypothetical protein
MTDIPVYSRSGLEQQQRNWEGRYTAVRLHNLSSTVVPTYYFLPIYKDMTISFLNPE